MRNFAKHIALLVVATLLATTLMIYLNAEHRAHPPRLPPQVLAFSELLAKAPTLQSVDIDGRVIAAKAKNGERYRAIAPTDFAFAKAFVDAGTKVTFVSDEGSLVGNLLLNFGPTLLIVGAMLWVSRKGLSGLIRKQATPAGEAAQLSVRWADVAGCDGAKAELAEVVDCLSDPGRYRALGAKIPRGILLHGSPGTGKTLLAKAVAGEAGVPFFSMSGSDFVEMYAGVGAARVRDLFAEARKRAPAIVFIDEIDAIGGSRVAGPGTSDERQQTLNQLLVEMNGFDEGPTVVVIAATNRPDSLDPALLRPGRFDRRVEVSLPDSKGREQILEVYLSRLTRDSAVTAKTIAAETAGSSGADLANLCNEAALCAARAQRRTVMLDDFAAARDKILLGVVRGVVMSDAQRRATAYHEAGHAVAATLLPELERVTKVSIVPRGAALGVTVQQTGEDRFSSSKSRLLQTVQMLFAGRIAEEIFVGEPTTGASNDFERATMIVREMVVRFGMFSDELGPVVFATPEADRHLSGGATHLRGMSESTARRIDALIEGVLRDQFDAARSLLFEHRDAVERVASELLEKEEIGAEDVERLTLPPVRSAA